MVDACLTDLKQALEQHLDQATKPTGYEASPVWLAARYSLLGSGKRVRPELLFRTCLMFNDSVPKEAVAFSASLEMIHSYSLIHDDLPAMDDDDFRRGRPSCHMVYGEATAILAGDLLLNRAYENMLSSIQEEPSSAVLSAMRELAQAAGGEGMILGQDRDLAMEDPAFGRASPSDVIKMAELKTARLIRAAVLMGGHLSDVPSDVLALLSEIGHAAGLSFQIKDDILDCVSNRDTLGKTPHKDEVAGKKTFVTVSGMQGALTALASETAKLEAGFERLKERGYHVSPLLDYLRGLVERTC